MREQTVEQANERQRHRPRIGGLEDGGERAIVHRCESGHEEDRRRRQKKLPVPAQSRIDPLRSERGDAIEIEAGVIPEHMRLRQEPKRRVRSVDPRQRHAHHRLWQTRGRHKPPPMAARWQEARHVEDREDDDEPAEEPQEPEVVEDVRLEEVERPRAEAQPQPFR